LGLGGVFVEKTLCRWGAASAGKNPSLMQQQKQHSQEQPKKNTRRSTCRKGEGKETIKDREKTPDRLRPEGRTLRSNLKGSGEKYRTRMLT